jgi:hypothetical protein
MVASGLTLVLVAVTLSGDTRRGFASDGNSSTVPNPSGSAIEASIALDSAGFPVIAYAGAAPLELVHCNDVNCVGGDESIEQLTATNAYEPALALDSLGNPVIAYRDLEDVLLVHCDDPNCSTWSTELVFTPPDAFGVGRFSLILDGSGNPVIAVPYQPISLSPHLGLLHCSDPDCASSPSLRGFASAQYGSLKLDSSGNPVLSFYDPDTDDLVVAHCNDPNCAPGGDSITPAFETGNVGAYSSLALDSSGFPVVSMYEGGANGNLVVIHCSDVNCTGVLDSIEYPDTTGDVGRDTSLLLDASGNPVISYYDVTNDSIKVMHCDDAGCASGGNSTITLGSFESESSFVLDNSGRPVLTSGDAVIHCADPNCRGDSTQVADNTGGSRTSITLDAAGNPVISYLNVSAGQERLGILHCSDPKCTGGTINSPDAVDTGYFTSIAPDGAGNPVVSHYDIANGNLKILHCNDPACAGGNESITAPHTTGDVGPYTSLKLDAAGYPVVSYYDATNDDLYLMHCNDPNCAGDDESIVVQHTTGDVGRYTSLELDASGYPVVSYHDETNGDLKILHCNDVNCAGGDESLTNPHLTSNDIGEYTSLELDSLGRPVVSYYFNTSDDLYVMHCNDVNCAGNDESTVVQHTTGDVGRYSSLKLDSSGYPVVSYYDSTNGDLKLLHCNDVNCSGTAESITTPDSANDVGTDSALALDAAGKPVVAYYDTTNDDLRVLHCNDENCEAGIKTSGGTPGDTDGDGCPDADEQQTAIGSETSGGRRDYLNPNDYFNPSGDGENRIDDILSVINQYFDDDDDGNPGLPPYEPGYNPNTDRTSLGPDQWDLGPPNGEQRIDDVLAIIYQYFHDCS